MRPRPCVAGKLQVGEIAAGQLTGLDEIAQVGTEGDAVAKVMVMVDVLLEKRIEVPVRSLDNVEGQGIEIAGASRHRGLSVALRGASSMPRPGPCRGTKIRQDHYALIPKMFEKRAALFVLELPGRALPLEKLANGLGQLGEAEIGKITERLMDQFEVGCGEISTGIGSLQFRHGCSPPPLLLVTLTYPERERMFSEKCEQVKKSHERDSKAAVDDSDCWDQSEKPCREAAGQASKGWADQAAKTADMRCANIKKSIIEWVE
jgi:hypothetical protein